MNQSLLFAVEYRLLSPLPDRLWHGDTLLLQIELLNRGSVPWLTWGEHPVRLAYHWRTPDGRTVAEDGPHAALPSAVPPNTSTTVELRVATPPMPGAYHLVIDLVEEGMAWFEERGVPALVVPLTYGANTAPRAVVINGNCVVRDAVGNHVVAQLRTLRAAGYQTLLLTEFVDDRLDVDVRQNATVVRLHDLQNPPPYLQATADFFRSADVVIFNYSTYYELAEAIKLVGNGAIIFDYHGVTPPELWGVDQPGYNDVLLGHQHINLVRYADYAIAHSEWMRGELMATGLIPAERVHVQPLGVVADEGYAQRVDPTLIERYNLAGKRVLLYVGRMARNKRLIDLVEALALVQQQHPETVLLLVGDNQLGPYRAYVAEVQARADELGCADAVIWTGQVLDLEPFYNLCDLFVTASVHEGFCAPVAEAMAHGKPVIAAAAAALPATVGPGGLLFEPENPQALAAQVTRLLAQLPPPDAPADPTQAVVQPDEIAQLREQTIAVVAPRYGPEILGGAESGIRGWAENLAARGFRVEALTTCTADMGDWRNHYEPGVEVINGVTVRRFATDAVDPGEFHRVLVKANAGEHVSSYDEQRFIENDLRSSDLDRYLHEHADELACAIFTPYLFGTTYWGARAIPDKALMVPCLHDEASAQLQVFRDMLEGAAGLLFNAAPESDLATNRLHVRNPRRMEIGYGFPSDPPRGDGAGFRARHNLPDQILLYSGRLERPKNVPLLLDCFVRYKNEHSSPLTLVLAGSGDVPIPQRPDIRALGMIVDRQELTDAYAAATMLCQPSLNESFSIVMMEAWLQARPVLMHADSAVTSDFVKKSGGGYLFRDYNNFATALDRVFGNPAHADELGRCGQAYVLANYTWDVLVNRIVEGIIRFTRPRTEYGRLAQHALQQSLLFTRTRSEDVFQHVVELARSDMHATLTTEQRQQLRALANVGMPGYTVRSGLPVVGRLVAWARKHMTSHLREPYLDPIIDRQTAFNQELLQNVVPLLEESLREQRRLRREVEVLRKQVKG